jgi:hypothetical protein
MNKVEIIFSKVRGQYCWNADWDSQLNLSVHFGAPHLRVIEPLPSRPDKRFARPSGKWWLWVFGAYWKVSLRSGLTASTSDSQDRKSRALRLLDGQILTQVAVNSLTGRTTLEFDLGGLLEIRRCEKNSQDELWYLYLPGKKVLTVRGDGKFSYGDGSQPERWAEMYDA